MDIALAKKTSLPDLRGGRGSQLIFKHLLKNRNNLNTYSILDHEIAIPRSDKSSLPILKLRSCQNSNMYTMIPKQAKSFYTQLRCQTKIIILNISASFCHTRLHLGFSAKLTILQVPICNLTTVCPERLCLKFLSHEASTLKNILNNPSFILRLRSCHSTLKSQFNVLFPLLVKQVWTELCQAQLKLVVDYLN